MNGDKDKSETLRFIGSKGEALEIFILKGSISYIIALSLQLGMRQKIAVRYVPPQRLSMSKNVELERN